MPIAEWPTIDTVVDRLAGNYARFLDRVPEGEEPDYLLWEGVNVVAAYADPSLEPDSEHLCLAILILEGVASSMPSANWDGLIERAIDSVAPGSLALVVCVLPSDLREPPQQTILYKFHGCAVKAGEDQATYRTRLIARLSQINRWANDQINAPIVNRLIDIATTKRTLMLGLSAQDGNIQNIFSAAQATMEWTWPVDPPAYVFCEDKLGLDQESLLQNVYQAGYSAATRAAIHDASLIRAYAKPLLSALALYVVFSKLEKLLWSAPGTLQAPDTGDIRRLRQPVPEYAEVRERIHALERSIRSDDAELAELNTQIGTAEVTLLSTLSVLNPVLAQQPLNFTLLHRELNDSAEEGRLSALARIRRNIEAARNEWRSIATPIEANPRQQLESAAAEARQNADAWRNNDGRELETIISQLSCSLSRGGAQFFTPPPRTAPIVGAHSRRQDPKTPVEQTLMRGLGTA